VMEVSSQEPQLRHMQDALRKLRVPVHVVHGDQDDFAPIDLAEQLVRETKTKAPIRFERVQGANHFMNDGPAEIILSVLETCIDTAKPAFDWKWPALPKLSKPSVPQAA